MADESYKLGALIRHTHLLSGVTDLSGLHRTIVHFGSAEQLLSTIGSVLSFCEGPAVLARTDFGPLLPPRLSNQGFKSDSVQRALRQLCGPVWHERPVLEFAESEMPALAGCVYMLAPTLHRTEDDLWCFFGKDSPVPFVWVDHEGVVFVFYRDWQRIGQPLEAHFSLRVLKRGMRPT